MHTQAKKQVAAAQELVREDLTAVEAFAVDDADIAGVLILFPFFFYCATSRRLQRNTYQWQRASNMLSLFFCFFHFSFFFSFFFQTRTMPFR